MKNFSITITELRRMTMDIEANSREEALEIAEKDYIEHLAEYDSALEPYDTIIGIPVQLNYGDYNR